MNVILIFAFLVFSYHFTPLPHLLGLFIQNRWPERWLLCQRVWTSNTWCQIILCKSCCQINNVHFIVLLPAMSSGVVVVVTVVVVVVVVVQGWVLNMCLKWISHGGLKKVYSLFIRYKSIYDSTCIWLVKLLTNIFCSVGNAWKAHSSVPLT